jgi:predicted dehydrogenase
MLHRMGMSRRGFLAQSVGAMAAFGLPLWYAREIVAADEEQASKVRRVGANDKIRFGLVGCGGMGRGDVGRFIGRPDCQLVALCDADAKRLAEAVNQFKEPAKKGGIDEIATHKDFRDLIARKDLDFVIVGTPDHWHTLPSLAAMKSGKDVYCEKPLTLFIEEGKALVKTSKATGRILQTGSQQRSEGKQWHLGCELVRNGRIGKVKQVTTFIGSNPKGGPFPVKPVPEGLDYDLWLGPTPKVEYCEKNCHYEFRWWYQWSGGKQTDWGAHMNDICQWGLGMDGSGPVSISATGEAPSTDPFSYNCHPSFKLNYVYANGVPVTCTNERGNAPGHEKFKANEGVRFDGEDGKWIFISRSEIMASDEKLIKEPLGQDATRLEVSTNHGGNFIDCIKSRKQPICNVEVGHRSVSVCHLGNIALRSGLKLTWNPAEEKFTGANAEEANKWLSRPYRAPWKLEA